MALRTFQERFGCEPELRVLAPGRVNLIGEHIDYALLPVLPMAIGQHLVVEAARTDDGQVIAESAAFPGRASVRRSAPEGPWEGWERYLAAAVAALGVTAPAHGARVLISGDLPAAAGLSSSAAFTTGVLAALSAVWGKPLSGQALVERAMAAEHHLGVHSGGMDQAAVVCGQAGHALHVAFAPLAVRLVPLPADLRIVVADSGETAAKGGAARDAYNRLVAGIRMAAGMLATEMSQSMKGLTVLPELMAEDNWRQRVARLPGSIPAEGLPPGSPTLAGGEVPVRAVAQHALAEAARVALAEDALRRGHIETFGAILDASHASLRDNLHCSTAALDRLCEAMRAAGAMGARLTGAGFGGYALAAVRPDQVATVIAAATSASGGPAFEVFASEGLRVQSLP